MNEFFSKYLYVHNSEIQYWFPLFLLSIVIYALVFMYDEVWFSNKFKFVNSLLTSIFFILAFFSGRLKELTIIVKAEPFGGIGEAIGSLFVLIVLPLLLSYIIMFLYKFTKPVLKKLHDKANEE